MRKILVPSFIVAFLAAADVASAQSVSFRAKVEDVPGTANQFVAGCTSTQLTSATIDLNAWIGLQVAIDGLWNGSVSAPSVVVQSIARAVESFEIGGNATIGGEIRFTAFGTPGDAALLAAGFAPAFIPFPGGGVAFLDPTIVIVAGVGPIAVTGAFEVVLPLPNDPGLIGLEVFGQGAIYGPSAGLLLTNPDCKTLQ